jgi:hypothetical protein
MSRDWITPRLTGNNFPRLFDRRRYIVKHDHYKFAQLTPEQLEKLRTLETELSRELDEPVILLAYDAAGEANRVTDNA